LKRPAVRQRNLRLFEMNPGMDRMIGGCQSELAERRKCNNKRNQRFLYGTG
jgi:hypothetical protein